MCVAICWGVLFLIMVGLVALVILEYRKEQKELAEGYAIGFRITKETYADGSVAYRVEEYWGSPIIKWVHYGARFYKLEDAERFLASCKAEKLATTVVAAEVIE